MTPQQIRVVLTGDSTGLENAGARSSRTIEGLVQASGNGQRSLTQLTGAAAQNQRQMALLAPQITDVVTSLAGGQSPMLVLIQQGGQLRDVFGGFAPALRAVASLFTLTRVAAGGLVATIGGLTYAYAEGMRQSQRFRDITSLTGNALGITEGQFNSLIDRASLAGRVTAGAAREIAEGLMSLGQFGPEALEAMTVAVARVSTVSGRASKDVIQDLAGMTKGVTAWASKYNEATNFITAGQLRVVRSLEQAGDKQGAMLKVTQALEGSQRNQAENLGLIERALKTTTEWWGRMWNAAMGIGRTETIEDRLKAARSRLEMAQQSMLSGDANILSQMLTARQQEAEANRQLGSDPSNSAAQSLLAKAQRTISDLQRQLAARPPSEEEQAARQQVADLEREQVDQRVRAANRARANRENQEQIIRDSAEFQASLLRLEASSAAQRLTQQQVDLDAERDALERSYREGELSLQGYAVARYQIEAKGIQDRAALIQSEIAAEQKRQLKGGSPAEVEQQKIERQARVNDLVRQAIPLQGELNRLNEQRRRGELLPPEIIDRAASTPRDDLRRFENSVDRPNIEAANQARVDASRQAASELVLINRQLNVDVIVDDRRRGMEQIALEEQELRRRLDLAALNAEDQKRVAEDLAQWRLLREKQLNEQLKPEWQRMTEYWGDSVRLMRDTWDNGILGVLREGEDAWLRFAQTGEISIKRIGQAWLAEQMRMQYRSATGSGGWLNVLFSSLKYLGSSNNPSAPNYENSFDLMNGGRAYGGQARPNSIIPVVERNEPEVLNTRRGTFLLTGAEGGSISPLQPQSESGTGGSGSLVFAPQISVDSTSDRAMVMRDVQQLLVQNNRQFLEMLRAQGLIR